MTVMSNRPLSPPTVQGQQELETDQKRFDKRYVSILQIPSDTFAGGKTISAGTYAQVNSAVNGPWFLHRNFPVVRYEESENKNDPTRYVILNTKEKIVFISCSNK